MYTYKTLYKPKQRENETLLKHISNISAFQYQSFDLPLTPDIHQIVHFFPVNITLNFTDKYRTCIRDTYNGEMRYLKMCGCPEAVSHPPNFSPVVHISIYFRIASYKKIGFVFHRKQMRFVNCYKNTNSADSPI